MYASSYQETLMKINSITNTAATLGTTQAGVTTASSSNSDGDSFMLMLMAQLRNQNPLEPMKDNEMMGQITQLNSLQALQTMTILMTQSAVSSQATYATSLIGKHVKAAQDDGSTIEGVVTGTSIVSGQLLLHIGDKTTTLGSVVEVQGA
jgi:flagellar basal-body rod modification protein FlgD